MAHFCKRLWTPLVIVQKPVISLGVGLPKHLHKITNLWKVELNYWSSKLQESNDRKNTLVAQINVLSDWFFFYSTDHLGCKRVMKERNTSVAQIYVFKGFRPKVFYFYLKITSFRKTTLLQREPGRVFGTIMSTQE